MGFIFYFETYYILEGLFFAHRKALHDLTDDRLVFPRIDVMDTLFLTLGIRCLSVSLNWLQGFNYMLRL
jgi:hypothetical protein